MRIHTDTPREACLCVGIPTIVSTTAVRHRHVRHAVEHADVLLSLLFTFNKRCRPIMYAPIMLKRTMMPLMALMRPRFPVSMCSAAGSSLSLQLNTWLESTRAVEERKRASLQKEAEAARAAEKLAQWATLVVSNLYQIDDHAESVIVEDWERDGKLTELRFDRGTGSPREQADAAFAKARRLRRGSAVIASLIEESEARERELDDWRGLVAEAAEEEAALHVLRTKMVRRAKKLKWKAGGLNADPPRSQQQDQPPPPQQQQFAQSRTSGWSGREFLSPGGLPILVGRNMKENEQLSLSVATEPDVWMHVRGAPGAHVLIRVSQVKGRPEPTDECLQMAADLAAFYSELREERKALVTLASPRHVTKPKGAPLGAVKLREESGTIVARPSTSEHIPAEARELRERERGGGGGGAGPGVVMSGGGSKRWS
jgi:predicted ribosome quality control (RQC) complex YloA/Tae2 family protein